MGAPKILLMCPPTIGRLSQFPEVFEDAEVKSRSLPKYYKEVADQYNCHFLNTGEVIKSSDIDGIHFDLDEHLKLGKIVARIVKKIFESSLGL